MGKLVAQQAQEDALQNTHLGSDMSHTSLGAAAVLLLQENMTEDWDQGRF